MLKIQMLNYYIYLILFMYTSPSEKHSWTYNMNVGMYDSIIEILPRKAIMNYFVIFKNNHFC